MLKVNSTSISIIIPAYNEERHIAACLDAISAQTQMPEEVILVDNNCSDNTVKIAEKYSFVKILKEKKQGRAHARNAGFNAAKSDILGRIDADSVLESEWVNKVKSIFENDNISVITGGAYTDLVPYTNRFKTTSFLNAYHKNELMLTGWYSVWGANCALRKSSWKLVENKLALDDTHAHEDQDIGFNLMSEGFKIHYIEDLMITTSGQSYRYLPKLILYTILNAKTKKLNYLNGNIAVIQLKLGRDRASYLKRISVGLKNIKWGIYVLTLSLLCFPIDVVLQRDKRLR